MVLVWRTLPLCGMMHWLIIHWIFLKPPAQLTKAHIILTVVSGWLSLQSSCCEIYGQVTTSKVVHMQSIWVLFELKDPEYLTTKPLLCVCLSVFVLLFGGLDGLVRLKYCILLTFQGELFRYRKLNKSMNDSSDVIRLSRCQFKAVD